MAKKFVPNDYDFAIAYYRFSSHAQSDTSIQQQDAHAGRLWNVRP